MKVKVSVYLLSQDAAARWTGTDAVHDLPLLEGPDLSVADLEQLLQCRPATFERREKVVRASHELV